MVSASHLQAELPPLPRGQRGQVVEARSFVGGRIDGAPVEGGQGLGLQALSVRRPRAHGVGACKKQEVLFALRYCMYVWMGAMKEREKEIARVVSTLGLVQVPATKEDQKKVLLFPFSIGCLHQSFFLDDEYTCILVSSAISCCRSNSPNMRTKAPRIDSLDWRTK